MKTGPTAKVPRLSLEEGSDRPKISLVTQEVCLFVAFAPEFDGERQSVDRLTVAADETAAKVYVLEVVFFGLEVGDLTDVVTVAQKVSGVASWKVFVERQLT